MDKKQAIFNENDIPYKELELIGISKKQIWSLDKANITALLSGKRTSLLDLSFHDNNGEEISMKGKISLYWKDSNNAGVKVHPVRPEIMNDINLKPKELERLQDNEIITKTINNEKYLVQLDPETNELLKTKIKSISIPSNIKGYSYIRDAITLVYNNPELIGGITKELYPEIGKKYNISITRVERSIRHAIEVSWNRGDWDLMEEIFGHSVDIDKAKPTNSEFIVTIADKLKLDTLKINS